MAKKKTEKKFISSYAFSKPHAEISVEASRFTKKCSDFFFIRRHGLSFFLKSYLFVYFFLRQHNRSTASCGMKGEARGVTGFILFSRVGGRDTQ